MSSHGAALRWSSLLLAFGTLRGHAAINHNQDPYSVVINNQSSAGPDGPWWFISQAIDYPDQYQQMMPSVSEFSLAINSSACRDQTACPLPVPDLWTTTGAYQVSDGPQRESAPFAPSTWDSDYASLLNLSGDAGFFTTRLTLHADAPVGQTYASYLDGAGMGISQNLTVGFPGGAAYIMDRGFFSLYGGDEDMTYQNASGSVVTANHTLQNAYLNGIIPSLSYGLHLGSVSPNVSGSLILGGYDSSRVLTPPIVSSNLGNGFQLTDIALNVSSGGFAYFNTSSALNSGLLRAPGGSQSSVNVVVRPGVPYLYLPQETCDAIALHLPVTYNADFNLYFWNTDKPAYQQIVSSPHYLAFTFAGDNGQQGTIKVPFALLNLTLETPLISAPTQYFPCSPIKDTGKGYTLGNAFLQAAFLAQNWQTGKVFLSQAPGPTYLTRNLKKIAYDATTLDAAANPPSWESSWSGTLAALPADKKGGGLGGNGGNGGSGSGSGTGSSKKSSLSGGAIAGIAIGAVAILALIAFLVWFLMRRRKRSRVAELGPRDSMVRDPGEVHKPYYSPVPHMAEHEHQTARHEMEAKPAYAHEMEGQREVGELQGDEPRGPGDMKYR
ncbi:hypothetical protein B0A48_06542 [Cryoendolithus antarcticus]|uniref:Peptidase A1 domain-containing protein n=1 Tax=Cryoendolithus antarcticus TaxID=1507870 RepID=A0A1V8TBU7_9PEZI|nr:hypothetical protein B0A48_06542 [Cryoendolithus antarcticus]